MLDPRLLRSFVALAEELHFGRAAERLHLAQPALSQQLRRLEQQVGARLVQRTSRSVELTAAGRAMLEPALAAVQAAEQAERAVLEASRSCAQPVKVGVDVYLDDAVAPVAACAAEHEEVSVWISRMPERQGQETLAAGQLDAFVGFTPPSEQQRRSRVRAFEVPIVALLSPEDPSARLPAVPLATFRRSTIAMAARAHGPERFDHWVSILSEGAGPQALSVREVDPPGPIGKATLPVLVAAREAVAFGPPATLAALAGDLRLVPFDPPLSVPAYVSWAPGRSAVVDAFVGALERCGSDALP